MFRTKSTKRVTLPNSDVISITEITPNPAEQPAAEDGHDEHDDFGRLSVCDDDIAGSENK